MLKNYFITSFRALARNKEYALINIVGLAVSIAASLILFILINYELSFDTFHSNVNSIHRIVLNYDYPTGIVHTQGISAPTREAIRNDFPQLKKVGTLYNAPNVQINITKDGNEVRYKEEKGVVFAEPELLEIFDFPWLYGNPRSALVEPNSVVLTQEIAEKYFGTWENAIGKVIRYGTTYSLKVNGILKTLPDNTDLPLKVLVSYRTFNDSDPNWGNVTTGRQLYVQLPDNVSAGQISSLFPAFEKKYIKDPSIIFHFMLQPLNQIHFDGSYSNLNNRTISKTTLLSLAIVGIFLLITASINFINLAIAQVIKKSKEVGVRKVLGSNRAQLILQFFSETFVILVTSTLVAVVLAEIALPLLRPVLNLPKNFNPVGSSETVLFLLLIIVTLTFLSAFYPAAIMTNFKPIKALKSKISNHDVGGISLRKGLVVTQFVIAQILVIVTMVVILQLSFFQNSSLGFDKESVVTFRIPNDSTGRLKMESLRNTLAKQSGIKNVSLHYSPPSWRSNSTSNFKYDRSTIDEAFEINQKFNDTSYFSTFGLQLVAGRIFQPSDTIREYVVNEAFLRKLGVSDPHEVIGKNITMWGNSPHPIVGVIKDFHTRSLHTAIEPTALGSDQSQFSRVSIKIDPRQSQEILAGVNQTFQAFFPELMFEYEFVDQALANFYKDEARLGTIARILAGLSIFISCLGLYGLISFMALQRTKEVGIRKVLGANVQDIVFLFSKEFILLVIIAFAIAAPIGGWLMQQWLTGFAFRINLTVWIFIIPVLGTLTMALLTMSSHSIKAARANPVDSLKTE